MVVAAPPGRFADRAAGWLGVAFLVTLLASEAALSLPDEHATAFAVASFYAAHRPVILVLQAAGVVAAALLAAFAWRLRVLSHGVWLAGLVLAVTTLAPTSVTMLLALTADPGRLVRAGRYNQLEPRGDDLLFVGVTVFAVAVLLVLGRRPRWLGALATLVAVCCLLRLSLEALGRDRGVLDALAPLSFLALVAALVWLCFKGFPAERTTGGERTPVNQG